MCSGEGAASFEILACRWTENTHVESAKGLPVERSEAVIAAGIGPYPYSEGAHVFVQVRSAAPEAVEWRAGPPRALPSTWRTESCRSMAEARSFLRAILGGVPVDSRVHLWLGRDMSALGPARVGKAWHQFWFRHEISSEAERELMGSYGFDPALPLEDARPLLT